MHGRTSFRLTRRRAAAVEASYLDRGGMLLGRFGLRQPGLQRIVPAGNGLDVRLTGKLERIARGRSAFGHGLWRIRSAECLAAGDPEAAAPGKPLEARDPQGSADLEGIKFGDRWGVVFSPDDLSCALGEARTRWSVGATRAKDAARIGLNVVLYSLQQ